MAMFLNISPEKAVEIEVRTSALHPTKPALHELRQLAVRLGWESYSLPVSPLCVASTAQRPVSTKYGSENPWFTLILPSTGRSMTTLDVQPMFEPHVKPSEDEPVFVRVMRHDATIGAGLQALVLQDDGTMMLEHYTLPHDLSLEYQGLNVGSPRSVDQTALDAQREAHRSTLDLLHQHVPLGVGSTAVTSFQDRR